MSSARKLLKILNHGWDSFVATAEQIT